MDQVQIDAQLVINQLQQQLADAQFQLAVARAQIAQMTASEEAGETQQP